MWQSSKIYMRLSITNGHRHCCFIDPDFQLFAVTTLYLETVTQIQCLINIDPLRMCASGTVCEQYLSAYAVLQVSCI